MENKIMMPACYNVMDEEEMTYTCGGDQYDAAAGLLGFTYLTLGILSVVELVDYVWGVAVSRNWISANKKDENGNKRDTSELFSKGMDDLSKYMGESFGNAFIGGFTAFTMVTNPGTWPITAIAWLTA